MRKNFGAKSWLYPQPVFIIATYAPDGTPDAMNAAWGGISGANQLSIYLSANHKTVKNLLARGAFTVSMATADHVAQCDYVGIESANNVPNKLQKAGFTVTPSDLVAAPIINELPMALECKLLSYDAQTCLAVGEIINVSVDDSALDANGNIDLAKLQPITFDAAGKAYYTLGQKVADAYRVGIPLKKQ